MLRLYVQCLPPIFLIRTVLPVPAMKAYSGADKSLARPGKKQATAKECFDFRISYL